jgi:asparagine synthetase B (glutamine-hydrolysing)
MTIDQLIVDDIDDASVLDECSVLLSGGVDSLSVAFAAHRLGKKIHAYSFHLAGNISPDFITAEYVSEMFGWEFSRVEIPVENLADDFHRLVEFGCIKKTHFECVYPFLYVYPVIDEEEVLTGWGADGYYGLSNTAQHTKKKWRVKENKERFDAFRDAYFHPDECAGYKYQEKIADAYDKVLITPYLATPIKDYFYAMDWDEINRPYEKHHIRDAFGEFSMIGKVEKHSNLQLNSGIDVLFATLLDDEEINFLHRTRVMDVCRDWVKKNKTGSLEDFI